MGKKKKKKKKSIGNLRLKKIITINTTKLLNHKIKPHKQLYPKILLTWDSDLCTDCNQMIRSWSYTASTPSAYSRHLSHKPHHQYCHMTVTWPSHACKLWATYSRQRGTIFVQDLVFIVAAILRVHVCRGLYLISYTLNWSRYIKIFCNRQVLSRESLKKERKKKQ